MYKYIELYSNIKKDILNNNYPDGTRLPTQETLSTKHGVSRITLKRALTLLENDGLIYTQQGSGTYIRRNTYQKNDNLLPLDLPVGLTESYHNRNISSKVLFFDARLPYDNEQKELSIEQYSPVYEFKRIRFTNSQPYSFEHVIIPCYIVELNHQVIETSLYNYLKKKDIILTDAIRVVSARMADEEISSALNINIKEPVLVIEQKASDQRGRVFELSTSYFIHSESKFLLTVHLMK